MRLICFNNPKNRDIIPEEFIHKAISEQVEILVVGGAVFVGRVGWGLPSTTGIASAGDDPHFRIALVPAPLVVSVHWNQVRATPQELSGPREPWEVWIASIHLVIKARNVSRNTKDP